MEFNLAHPPQSLPQLQMSPVGKIYFGVLHSGFCPRLRGALGTRKWILSLAQSAAEELSKLRMEKKRSAADAHEDRMLAEARRQVFDFEHRQIIRRAPTVRAILGYKGHHSKVIFNATYTYIYICIYMYMYTYIYMYLYLCIYICIFRTVCPQRPELGTGATSLHIRHSGLAECLISRRQRQHHSELEHQRPLLRWPFQILYCQQPPTPP